MSSSPTICLKHLGGYVPDGSIRALKKELLEGECFGELVIKAGKYGLQKELKNVRNQGY